mmetsp:Transcript_17099/g.38471  ORF Transcript_17099/g.38471 Transcript_17099/m.38471 type:complete len:165 (-) Transcript_17099:1817-2311(-)
MFLVSVAVYLVLFACCVSPLHFSLLEIHSISSLPATYPNTFPPATSVRMAYSRLPRTTPAERPPPSLMHFSLTLSAPLLPPLAQTPDPARTHPPFLGTGAPPTIVQIQTMDGDVGGEEAACFYCGAGTVYNRFDQDHAPGAAHHNILLTPRGTPMDTTERKQGR